MRDPVDDSSDYFLFDALDPPFLGFANPPPPKPFLLASDDLRSSDEDEPYSGIEKYLEHEPDGFTVLKTKTMPAPAPEPSPTISLYSVVFKIDSLERELRIRPSLSGYLEHEPTINELRKIQVSSAVLPSKKEIDDYEKWLEGLRLDELKRRMKITTSAYFKTFRDNFVDLKKDLDGFEGYIDLDILENEESKKENPNCFFNKRVRTEDAPQPLTTFEVPAYFFQPSPQRQRIKHVEKDGLAYIFDASSRIKQRVYDNVLPTYPNLEGKDLLEKLLEEARRLRLEFFKEAVIKMKKILFYQRAEYNKAVREFKKEYYGIIPTSQIEKLKCRQEGAKNRQRLGGRFVKKDPQQEASIAAEEGSGLARLR